ncbi:MAG: 30S ribosomal protein S16 [Deltaproteobacteria bacterium]|jgi:small subunit ribosomal protein S16|nr:30S ribosomal protein S16 [Deltaproteobacteria bacterium]
MALKIRLARLGGKKKPYYRLVVADSQAKRDGRFIAIVGHYDPKSNPYKLDVDHDAVSKWIGQGALPTDTVASLIRASRRRQAATA